MISTAGLRKAFLTCRRDCYAVNNLYRCKMPETIFKPTSLDLALEHDPVARAAEHRILAASNEATAEPSDHRPDGEFIPVEGREATRQGQRVTAAASLAGGMIAAEGRPVTAAEAVEKVRAVLDELDHV